MVNSEKEKERIKGIIDILRFVYERELSGIAVNKEDLKKAGFSDNLLNYCVGIGDLIDIRDGEYFLHDNGLSLLNQFNISKNTKELKEVMKNFSGEAKKHSKLMRKYTIILIALTISLLVFSFWQFYNERTNQINEVISDVESLEVELDKNLESINKIIELEENLSRDITYFQFPLENLRTSSANGDIRNKTIKTKIIILYIDFLQANKEIETINSIAYIISTGEDYYEDKAFLVSALITTLDVRFRDRIEGLKIALENYKKCIETKRNFDKC